MEWTAAMQQTITYIKEHLLEEINYEDAAILRAISSTGHSALLQG